MSWTDSPILLIDDFGGGLLGSGTLSFLSAPAYVWQSPYEHLDPLWDEHNFGGLSSGSHDYLAVMATTTSTYHDDCGADSSSTSTLQPFGGVHFQDFYQGALPFYQLDPGNAASGDYQGLRFDAGTGHAKDMISRTETFEGGHRTFRSRWDVCNLNRPIKRNQVKLESPSYAHSDEELADFDNKDSFDPCSAFWVPGLDAGFTPQGVADFEGGQVISGYTIGANRDEKGDDRCALAYVGPNLKYGSVLGRGEEEGSFVPIPDVPGRPVCTHGGGIAVDAQGRFVIADTDHLFLVDPEFLREPAAYHRARSSPTTSSDRAAGSCIRFKRSGDGGTLAGRHSDHTPVLGIVPGRGRSREPTVDRHLARELPSSVSVWVRSGRAFPG